LKPSQWLIAVQFVQAAAAEGWDKHCIQNAPDPLENPWTEWIQRMHHKYAAPFSLELQPYPDFGIELHRGRYVCRHLIMSGRQLPGAITLK
jgi:hypothetical protein